MMKVAIMQPYFLPYVGYFQLLNGVDKFVVYDNIQYTKKGWISRNRILLNGADSYISLMLKKDSDYLNIVDRSLADDFEKEKVRLLRRIEGSYKKAPHFQDVIPLVQEIINYNESNLFRYILFSIKSIASYLSIKTEIVISSSLSIDHSLTGKDKVIALCKSLNAESYINPIGGVELYDKNEFARNGIELSFLKSKEIKYHQGDFEFVPWLSILDVLMFNGKDKTIAFLNEYELL